jgi:hypothetical protein
LTRDILNESDDDDNESYSDFEPEIARKIQKIVCHLSSDSESGSAEQQVSDDKSYMYSAAGDCDMARRRHISKLIILVDEIQTVLVFLGEFLEICVNKFSRKLLLVAKESENIRPGNAELQETG